MESTITEVYSSSLKVNINLIDPIVVIYECKIAYRLYAYGGVLSMGFARGVDCRCPTGVTCLSD
jgi:hypothetical protein